jgi:hypothetical protein
MPEKKAPLFSLSGGLLDSTERATLLQASLADKMIEMSLNQRLHQLRDKADLSLRELATRVGVSSPFLSKRLQADLSAITSSLIGK